MHSNYLHKHSNWSHKHINWSHKIISYINVYTWTVGDKRYCNEYSLAICKLINKGCGNSIRDAIHNRFHNYIIQCCAIVLRGGPVWRAASLAITRVEYDQVFTPIDGEQL